MLSELYKILLMASISIIIVIFGMYQYVSYQNDNLDIKLEQKDKDLEIVPLVITKEKFETKWESLKPKPLEVKHEELNTSRGKHSITFRP